MSDATDRPPTIYLCECGARATFLVRPFEPSFLQVGWVACDVHLANAVRSELARHHDGVRLRVKPV